MFRIKQLKKPTRQQRKVLEAHRLNAADWMVERDTPEEMTIVHRHFESTKKVINKES